MPDWIVQIGFGRRAGVLVIALLNGALSTAPRSQPKWQKVQLESKKIYITLTQNLHMIKSTLQSILLKSYDPSELKGENTFEVSMVRKKVYFFVPYILIVM
jgi:hypothetical protein